MFIKLDKDGRILSSSAFKVDETYTETDKNVVRGYDGWLYFEGEEPEKPQEQIEAEALAQSKAERADAVSKIIVEVDGMAFDGDEESQQRVARSIIALEDGETMPWVLYDNTIAEVTKEQLKQVLRLAGQRQSELWVVPYANDK